MLELVAQAGITAKVYRFSFLFFAIWRTVRNMHFFRGLLGLALAGLCSVQAQTYTPLSLGTLGGTASAANAISSVGHIVGWAQDAAGRQQAFLWRQGAMTGLGFIPGTTSSVATAVNRHGRVTGASLNNPLDQKAFLYDNGNLVNLGTLGGASSAGRGINDRGEITGWTQIPNMTPISTDPQTFIWRTNTMSRVASYYNYSSCEGNAINQTGLVAGITATWTPHLRWWAYVWSDLNGNGSNDFGEMKLMGTLGGLFSYARGINDRNEVVGAAQNTQGVTRAFLVSPVNGAWKVPASEIVITNALMVDLGSLAGPTGTSEALSINNLGTIVGTSSSSNGPRAVLWRSGSITDLNTLIPEASGWTLQAATGINDREEIVGYGMYQGEQRAFLLHQPGRITSYFPVYRYESRILTNEASEVYTQQVSRLERFDMAWSSTWSDPPTNHTLWLEYQPPADAAWQTSGAVSNEVLLIETNQPLVLQNTSLWFRLRAVW